MNRPYEQGANAVRIGDYVQHWWTWVSTRQKSRPKWTARLLRVSIGVNGYAVRRRIRLPKAMPRPPSSDQMTSVQGSGTQQLEQFVEKVQSVLPPSPSKALSKVLM